MANQILNSAYGITYNISGTSASINKNNNVLPICFNVDASNTFNGCLNLQLNLRNLVNNISMSQITNASSMYYICNNLSGAPVCGDSVVNASYMYYSCNNLTGSPVCGANVTDASYMYYGCSKLTGFPVCGDSVVNASYMYSRCWILTGSPVCGDKVTNASSMYYGCNNLSGGGTLYLNNCTNCRNMLYNVPRTNRRNIYVKPGSTLDTAIKASSAAGNIYNNKITWTDMTNGYYSTTYNIYVYNNAT